MNPGYENIPYHGLWPVVITIFFISIHTCAILTFRYAEHASPLVSIFGFSYTSITLSICHRVCMDGLLLENGCSNYSIGHGYVSMWPLERANVCLISFESNFTIAPLSFCEFLFNTNVIYMLGLCSFMLSTFEYLFVFQTKDMSFFMQHCKSRVWSPSRIHVNCSPRHS